MEQVADHAVILHQGQAVAQGPLGQLRSSPRPGLHVRTHGDPQPLVRRLLDAGVSVEPTHPMLRVGLTDAAELLRHAEACGVVVRHVAPIELSLGETFEQIVGGARVA